MFSSLKQWLGDDLVVLLRSNVLGEHGHVDGQKQNLKQEDNSKYKNLLNRIWFCMECSCLMVNQLIKLLKTVYTNVFNWTLKISKAECCNDGHVTKRANLYLYRLDDEKAFQQGDDHADHPLLCHVHTEWMAVKYDEGDGQSASANAQEVGHVHGKAGWEGQRSKRKLSHFRFINW